MSIVGQPNTILTVYSPFAWIEDTITGNFITYPTAQDAEITFPGSIVAHTIGSYDPTETSVFGYMIKS